MELNYHLDRHDHPLDDSHHESMQSVDPADHYHDNTNVCLLKRNHFSRKPLINVIFTIIMTSSIFLSLYCFIKTENTFAIAIPMLLDICLTVICLFLYSKFPEVFNVASNDLHKVKKRETAFVAIRCLMLVLVMTTVAKRRITLFQGFCILSLTVIHVILDFRRDYDTVFDSVFNLIGLSTMNLAWVKLLTKDLITWREVFVFYNVSAWLSTVIFVIDFILHAILVVVELVCRKKKVSLKIALIRLFLAFNFFFFSQAYFGMVDYSSGEDLVFNLRLEPLLLVSVVYFMVHGALVVKYDRELHQVMTVAEQHYFEEKKGLNYVLNMMRSTPTYFKSSPSFTRRESANPGHSHQHHEELEEEIECVVCCEKTADCVFFPCMHSGGCRSCSISMIRAKNECMICREQIVKIAVTEKMSRSEYKVLEEIIVRPRNS